MPIIGNLSEFPLPEVLLLIGVRTGRLRLLDLPEFGVLDIDFSDGEAQAMHLGLRTLTEPADMIDKLSAVVQSQVGMFEFRVQEVKPVMRKQPLPVNQLVMSLVCYVDEEVARQKATASPHCWYMLETAQPEIWIEPDLHGFFIAARPFLVTGCYVDDLAQRLKMETDLVHKNLTNLRLLGLIKLVDGASTVPLTAVNVQEQVARKSNDFLRASRAMNGIKRKTGKVPPIQNP